MMVAGLTGCEVWREGYFKVSVKNSTLETFEIFFNDEFKEPLLLPGQIEPYRPRVIVRGVDYSTGYSYRWPECARIHLTARIAGTNEFAGTISFRMCQDEEVLVEITPTHLVVLNKSRDRPDMIEF